MRDRLLLCLSFGALAACSPAEPGPSQHAASDQIVSSAAASQASPAPPLPSTSAPSVAPVAPAGPPAKVRYVVAAMGDSLTDPKSHGGKYLDVLRERCPKSTFVSFGKGGNMVNMMRKRFMRDVYGEGTDAERPAFTHVLILGGLGDVLSNETAFRTPKKIADDIGQMVDMARSRGAKAVVLTLPPWGGMKAFNAERARITAEVNVWIEDAAKQGRIDGTFDTRPHLVCGSEHKLCDKYAWPDGIHWSAAGHRSVGEALHHAMFSDCE